MYKSAHKYAKCVPFSTALGIGLNLEFGYAPACVLGSVVIEQQEQTRDALFG